MNRIALALACLAFSSHARRMQSPSQYPEAQTLPKVVDAPKSDRQAGADGLAKLLMASTPAATFNPSVTGALVTSRPVKVNQKSRLSHTAARMVASPSSSSESTQDTMTEAANEIAAEEDFEDAEALFEQIDPATLALGFAALTALNPEEALAKGGEFGIFEGRIVSLAHPAIMALMYAASAFAAYTGYNWRRLREIGTEISDLKKEKKELEAKLDPTALEDDPAHAKLKGEVAALSTKIDEMSATRKEMAGSDFRDKHWAAGSLILGLGTSFAIEGPVNTFLRAQKLFPGPHLYAGAGVLVSWALAASLVPQMQKGKDYARNAHIAINVLALGLFTWQLPTGWEITQKVIKFTKFP